MKVALWAGISYGTVRNITIQVMTHQQSYNLVSGFQWFLEVFGF